MKGNDQLDWKNKIKSFRRNFFPFGSVLFRKPHTVEREKNNFLLGLIFTPEQKPKKKKKIKRKKKQLKTLVAVMGGYNHPL
jgi:hypothetical protein